YCYDEEKVNRMQGELEKEDIFSVAQLFKAIADENRAKMTFALYKGEEVCVCDIANSISVTVANASQQLRTVHKQGGVKFSKECKLSVYSLDDEHVEQLFVIGLTHMKEVQVNV